MKMCNYILNALNVETCYTGLHLNFYANSRKVTLNLLNLR
jgi:hypothetical protein